MRTLVTQLFRRSAQPAVPAAPHRSPLEATVAEWNRLAAASVVAPLPEPVAPPLRPHPLEGGIDRGFYAQSVGLNAALPAAPAGALPHGLRTSFGD